jgi:hypothetical protein
MLNFSFQNMEAVSLEWDKMVEERDRQAKERRVTTPKAGSTGPFSSPSTASLVSVAEDSDGASSESSDVARGVVQVLVAGALAQAKAPKGKFGWCTVCGNTANHYCLQVKQESFFSF